MLQHALSKGNSKQATESRQLSLHGMHSQRGSCIGSTILWRGEACRRKDVGGVQERAASALTHKVLRIKGVMQFTPPARFGTTYFSRAVQSDDVCFLLYAYVCACAW